MLLISIKLQCFIKIYVTMQKINHNDPYKKSLIKIQFFTTNNYDDRMLSVVVKMLLFQDKNIAQIKLSITW